MLIVCPHCATQHDVPDDFIGEAGRKVRCSGCREIWHAQRPVSDARELSATETGQASPPQDQTGVDALMTADGQEGSDIQNPLPQTGFEMPGPIAKPGRGARKTGARGAQDKLASPKTFRRRWTTVTIAASFALLIGLVAFRGSVVRTIPQMARLYAMAGLTVNLRGLELSDVATKLFTDGDTKLLIVGGDVTNISRQPIRLPSLRFALRNAEGVEIYSWTAKLDKPQLEPGETLAFKRRLAAPPPEGKDVVVRFMSKTDLASLGSLEPKTLENHP